MNRSIGLVGMVIWSMGLGAARGGAAEEPAFRPPAVPLVAHDPYLSIWSMADRLTDDSTRHWTRRPHPLASLIRIDGSAYRLMGPMPREVPSLAQRSVRVLPTRTLYEFTGAGVQVVLEFMTPALPEDLEVLARPVTYLTWRVTSADGKPHQVAIYASASGLLTVNEPSRPVELARERVGDLTVLRAGAAEQTLLRPAGDDTRINWGHAYLAANTAEATAALAAASVLEDSFVRTGKLPATDDLAPRAANDREPTMALAFDLGQVASGGVERHLMIAYDELYAVEFLGRKLRPYWRRRGAQAADLLLAAQRDYASLKSRCQAFDAELRADLDKAGGEHYARLGCLAYRQALAGCGLAADAGGEPLLFPKENSSNGCVATVDVIYPAAPLFLLMGPTYARALVAPPLVYGASERWKFPFAPHDVGTYPLANGQVYAGGEHSTNEGDMMPVEESGNMILLLAAITQMEGNADFAAHWSTQLKRWEAYLEHYGKDPENQLCTDDFMGHLAHNANLSIKAILAIAAQGRILRRQGDAQAADRLQSVARSFARNWMEVAADDDHYRIAFDRPGTWSQKYNLVWDQLLELEVFPPEVARREIAFYKTRLERFGLPLDSRTKLTKTDWCLWTATMAGSAQDFHALVDPIYDYMNITSARLPMVDSYMTTDPASDGMRARPVIGGIFIKLLEDRSVWSRWASKDRRPRGVYAPAPLAPVIKERVSTSASSPAVWKYTLDCPAQGWTEPAFDDSSWKQGPGGFGTRGTPGAVVRTLWNTGDLWLRRQVELPHDLDPEHASLLLYHDEDAEVYFNGVLAARETGYVTTYQPVDISAKARSQLKPGSSITIAVHCRQTGGGQAIDLGIVEIHERQPGKP